MTRFLITGASRGIGRAIAVRLAEPERMLLLHGRDQAALTECSTLVKSRGADTQLIMADLSHVAGIESLVTAAGKELLSGLIINAGIAFVKPVEEITLEEWQKTLAINVTAPFLLIQKLLPALEKRSSIVNILSVAARTGFPNWSSYCMSKFALEGFSQSLREELRPRGIRVINIYPTATATDIWNDIAGDWPRDKMLSPDEVAEAVAYAISRPSSVLVDSINVGDAGGTL